MYIFVTVVAAALQVSALEMNIAHTIKGYIESAEQSRMAEQNKISKLTVKLPIISTERVAECNSYWQNITYTGRI